MTVAMELVETLQNGLRFVLEAFASYLFAMRDIIRNTMDQIDFPKISFSFDSITKNKSILNKLWKWQAENSSPAIAALVWAVVLFIFVRLLLWCCCGGRGQSASRRDHRKDVHRQEARRWFSQAELDYEASQNDMGHAHPAYEWVCFKCQQAAEKAIKAAIMVRHPNRSPNREGHDLAALSYMLGDSRLQHLAAKLHGHIGVVPRMRYPDLLPFPKTPRDVYTEDIATKAFDVTGEVLQHVQNKYIEI